MNTATLYSVCRGRGGGGVGGGRWGVGGGGWGVGEHAKMMFGSESLVTEWKMIGQ